MLAFISSHLKHVVTVGFIIGLMSLAVRYLDDKLSTEQKDQFSRRIRNIESKLKALTLFGVHAAIRPYRWIYLGLIVAVWTLLNVKINYTLHRWNPAFPGNGVKLFYFIIGLLFLLFGWCKLYLLTRYPSPSDPDFVKKAMKKELKKEMEKQLKFLGKEFVQTVVIVAAVAIVLTLVSTFVSHDPVLGNFLLKYGGLSLVSSGLPGVLFFLPFGVIALLRIPVALIAKPVFWISAYPKGPWAGLVFALTMALGIFRLFL
jgi:hypothetical protein